MKLSSGFITHNDGDDKILVSTGATQFSGLVRSNQTAGFIIECLKKETTEAEILEDMKAKYEGSEELMKRDITKVINQLREIGAIDE